MSSGGYAAVSGQMYWRMYSGHNCTNYAAYRVIKNGYSSTRPWDGSGNATYWGTQMASITDRTPRVGAIAWWRAGVYPAGSAGHVAYVERVISPTEIIISQDSWGGDFSWARVTSTSGWPSGFIHFNDRAAELKNVERPVISGDTTVGSTLTASRGEWRPGDPSLVFEWRSAGEAIQTGTSNKLELHALPHHPAREGQGHRTQERLHRGDRALRADRADPTPPDDQHRAPRDHR